jgi:hypothetical protein
LLAVGDDELGVGNNELDAGDSEVASFGGCRGRETHVDGRPGEPARASTILKGPRVQNYLIIILFFVIFILS